jgi:hypothetical protein
LRGRISAASAATASRPTRWSSSITAMSEASPDGALDKTNLRALSLL